LIFDNDKFYVTPLTASKINRKMKESLMKKIIALVSILCASNVFANVAQTDNPMDFGIVAGALFSTKTTVKAGKYTYSVIAPDLTEPACNSIQAIVWVQDDTLEGDAGGATYNLGIQINQIISVKAKGDQVIIKTRRNSTEDCSKGNVETYAVQYTGGAAELKVKLVK
jgi:hypothetical protein